MMIALGLVIAVYPHPYWLAIGVGTVVPPVAYLTYALRKGAGRIGETGQEPTTEIMCAASSLFIAAGMAWRLWEEYAMSNHALFLLAGLGLAGACALLVQLVRKPGGLPAWRFLLFALYFTSVLGLANIHLDRAPPRYADTAASSRDNAFCTAWHPGALRFTWRQTAVGTCASVLKLPAAPQDTIVIVPELPPGAP